VSQDFNVGDQVFVVHQCERDQRGDIDLSKPTIVYEVVEPRRPTDMVSVHGVPIGYYVMVRCAAWPEKRPSEGYHRQNVMRMGRRDGDGSIDAPPAPPTNALPIPEPEASHA
jgi:hypothetical protein